MINNATLCCNGPSFDVVPLFLGQMMNNKEVSVLSSNIV